MVTAVPQTDTLFPVDLWADLCAVRERAPLVHNITNLVAANLSANVLLAAGAAPVMAHAPEEVQDMVAHAQALVLNIGTPDPYWIDSMALAMTTACARGIPVVLDPVGAGATPYRNASVERLLKAGTPHVIRGNASEILSVAGQHGETRGVDSSAGTYEALEAARSLALATGAVVCVSGSIDHVVDARGRWVRLKNGHPWMTRITGVGCAASALIGAFCAVQPDPWRATASAMTLMALAGEVAAEQATVRRQGVGSMQALLLDAVQLLDEPTFHQRLIME